jgi:hypothetical protein
MFITKKNSKHLSIITTKHMEGKSEAISKPNNLYAVSNKSNQTHHRTTLPIR